MNITDIFIKDQDFTEKLNGEILPFIESNIVDGYFTNVGGLRLHYELLKHPHEKKLIVISHGYCEFTRKYAEVMYYFYHMGYSVAIMEHRGHGFSAREVPGYSMVHIDRFQNYVDDFAQFVDEIVIPTSSSGKPILFAHSMGGAIAALYLEQHPLVFEKAILSSPMIGLKMDGINPFALKLVLALSHLPFLNKRYVPGHHDYDFTFNYPKCSALSKPRYNLQYVERGRVPQYRSNGATFGWTRESFNVSKKILKNANLVEIPVILMQASEDDLVLPEAQNDFAVKAKNCRLYRFEGSKHEIFNATDEIIIDYYNKIFDFIGQ